jgi:hypothetical protein
MNIQEAYRTPNRLDQKRNSSGHIVIKTTNALKKKKERKNRQSTGRSSEELCAGRCSSTATNGSGAEWHTYSSAQETLSGVHLKVRRLEIEW